MSRWFRFYDDAVNDPKVQRLEPKLFKAWVNMLCLASKNDGWFPPIDDVAFSLRLSETETGRVVDALISAGLVDEFDGKFCPHNWKERQFKSDKDPTAADRKRRQRERDSDRDTGNVTRDVTHESRPPDTDTDTDTEEKKDGADAPLDPAVPERGYFLRGREVLGKGAGGLIGKLLKAKGGNVALARAAIEQASQKQNPTEYVAAICRGPPTIKPQTAHQQERQTGREILDDIGKFVSGSSSENDPRVLRYDPGDGPEGIRGGTGGNLIELSASGNRSRG